MRISEKWGARALCGTRLLLPCIYHSAKWDLRACFRGGSRYSFALEAIIGASSSYIAHKGYLSNDNDVEIVVGIKFAGCINTIGDVGSITDSRNYNHCI